jgi:hypothetical protein
LIDPRRVVLRGFSMGGAGAWHLGLHHPDRWCVIGPGAGFSTTRGYLKNLPDPLPPYVAAGLHVFDAVDYAENAAMVPVVAYAGDDDPQRQAALTIQERLTRLEIPMTFLQAPGLKHEMPLEWRKKAEAEYAKYAGPGRPAHPEHVRFVTYTLKYPKCEWVELLALEKHYEQTRVDAMWGTDEIKVVAANVQSFRLGTPDGPALPKRIVVNGRPIFFADRLAPQAAEVILDSADPTHWGVIDNFRHHPLPPGTPPRKSPGVQGPIDDAFTGPFLCVRGTGPAASEAVKRYVDADFKRFEREWDQFMRGKLPVKDDTAVTREDIASHNLIVFGYPSSTSLIVLLNFLPLEWSVEKLQFAGRTVDAAAHLPVLIYPTPFNPKRYIVLNSGHTFHAADFKGTNALLYPRLGDFALLKLPPADAKDPLAAEVVTAGIFDDDWKLPGR